MPRLLCMKRPKLSICEIPKNSGVKNKILSLSGSSNITVTKTHHHPLCPSSETTKYVLKK